MQSRVQACSRAAGVESCRQSMRSRLNHLSTSSASRRSSACRRRGTSASFGRRGTRNTRCCHHRLSSQLEAASHRLASARSRRHPLPIRSGASGPPLCHVRARRGPPCLHDQRLQTRAYACRSCHVHVARGLWHSMPSPRWRGTHKGPLASNRCHGCSLCASYMAVTMRRSR